MAKHLTSFDEVVGVLGGTAQVARLCKRSQTAVCNWRKRGRFPTRLFFVMYPALKHQNVTAPLSLWGFVHEARTIEIDPELAAA